MSDSIDEIAVKITNNGLTKELLHKLKGSTGNMRFKNIYQLSNELEKQIDNLLENEKEEAKEAVLKHINHIKTLIATL